MDTLQFTWFVLFFVLFIGYAILDGLDLGIGIISLFTRKQENRTTLLNTVTPAWDGNEAWLLTAGGALYIAFPPAYTLLFNAFYGLFAILLLALIVRIACIELGHLIHNPAWLPLDLVFGVCSLIPACLLGMILANMLRGLPINNEGVYEGTALALFNPYSLLGGLLSLITFMLHGAAFGATKTRGDLQNTMRQWVSHLWVIMVVLWICMTVYTFFEARYLFEGVFKNAVFDGLAVLFLISILVITISSSAQKDGHTFLASSVAMTCMLGMAGACLHPLMIPSNLDLANSITLPKASSPPIIQKTMLTIALTGILLALVFRVVIYRGVKRRNAATNEY